MVRLLILALISLLTTASTAKADRGMIPLDAYATIYELG
jgi:hypothetical protein